MTSDDFAAWFPIASSDDLPFRHVYHGQLLGQEFAVWRADDGHVNVWENRCLHRGVRLSIGLNEGRELKCQYHGWRYANRSAGCTYIPAHPADAPARRITNRVFASIERGGLVWASLADEPSAFPEVADGSWLPLRPMPINARPEAVLDRLRAAGTESPTRTPPFPRAIVTALDGADGVEALYVVQPVDSGRAVVRGVLLDTPEDISEALFLQNRLLSRLRRQAEEVALADEAPAPIVPVYLPVSPELASMPGLRFGQQDRINVHVARKWQAAEDVTALELAPLSGHLPTFQPGAHIDVHLPNGMTRQYSITNGPGELLSYTIGVKREANSKGGSASIADNLREGDLLAISEPRNNFPLRRDATRTILIGGGIGITPLISMARALHGSDLAFAFHAFVRSNGHLPFAAELSAFGASLVPHVGLDPEATEHAVHDILGAPGFARHAYVCGPSPMLDMVRRVAADLGWPDEALHFEYFGNTRPRNDQTPFTVELARSALTLEIPAGKSILDVLRANGIEAPASCEQGACGTCLTTVLEGEPDHQDVYLNNTEKAANTCMMTCVSRAKTSRLVLDI